MPFFIIAKRTALKTSLIPHLIGAMLLCTAAGAQELYIFTDPASNVPAHALSMRLNYMHMPAADVDDGKVNRNMQRFAPDVSYGVSKNLMLKASGYFSDMFQSALRWEGASLSAKYRFLSQDDFHKHFRMAAFGKVAFSRNPYFMHSVVTHQYPDGNGGTIPHTEMMHHPADEQMLEGTHGGWQAGVVATQLLHKLALSGTLSTISRWNNGTRFPVPDAAAQGALQYTLSAGYLLFPRSYQTYRQVNLNLYMELMGQSAYGRPNQFLDAAPALQFIIGSKARVDVAYRFQVTGNMRRFNEEQFLLRLEYNWLQAFRGKKEG